MRLHAHAADFHDCETFDLSTLLLNGLSLVRIEDGPMLGSGGNVVLRYLNYYLPSSAKQHLLALKSFHNITLMLNVIVMLSILSGFVVI